MQVALSPKFRYGSETADVIEGSTSTQYSLRNHKRDDFTIVEMDYVYVRPSSIVVITGTLGRAEGLRIAVDIDYYMTMAKRVQDSEGPIALYHDCSNTDEPTTSLIEVLSQLPMFKNEKGLVEQVVHDYGNFLEISPIVHCEVAGRGIEYANGRAKWNFRNGCTGKLSEMEALCRRAYSERVIPQQLMAKYERRVRDYMRSYRIGAMTSELDKLRSVIKSHRNMLDSYEAFVKSGSSDDSTDVHCLDISSITKAIAKATAKPSTPSRPQMIPCTTSSSTDIAACRNFHLVRNCTCLPGLCQ